MKRIVSLLLVLMLTMGMLVGCEKANKKTEDNLPANSTTDSTTDNAKFEEKDGLLVCTDTKNGPFEDSGLKISIKKGEDGYAEFIKTDLEGNETVDYYIFDYATNTVEKYYYVSAMGTAFYYYYDLEKEELVKVENGDHEDTTDKTKSSGRWDGAAENMEDEVNKLENYFKEQYNMTIKKAVLENE